MGVGKSRRTLSPGAVGSGLEEMALYATLGRRAASSKLHVPIS